MSKNALPYYKAYPRDFFEGTMGMSGELKGAYRLLIDAIYMKNGSLVEDDRYIAGLLGVSLRKWRSHKEALLSLEKIEIKNGIISNKRARFELEITSKYQEKQAENRSGYNKNNDIEKPPSNQPEPEPDISISSDIDISKKPPKKSKRDAVLEMLQSCVSQESANAFYDYRAKIQKPLSEIATKRIVNTLEEIKRAGGDADDAIGLALERGWRSIEVDWYFKSKGGQNGSNANNSTNTGRGQSASIASIVARSRTGT